MTFIQFADEPSQEEPVAAAAPSSQDLGSQNSEPEETAREERE